MRIALQSRQGIVEKKMFGRYCWVLNGNMLCGAEVGRYLFRVGRDVEPKALARPGAMPTSLHLGRCGERQEWVTPAGT
jgi:hypothetical protein